MNFIKSYAKIGLAASTIYFANGADARDPNVIVIMVDDMGYGGVSCFDNQNFKTPEIDRLCAEGMKLTDFHSNGAVCSPTRAALMTGRYQQRSGCDTVLSADPEHPMHQIGLHDSEWTFPEAMKSGGYKTAIFGKWHLGYKSEFHPMNHGFDEFNGFVSGNICAHSHMDRMEIQDWWQGKELKDEAGYHTDLINRHALKFIEENKDQPFFLYVAHGAPHSPNQAPGSAFERGPNKGKIPEWAPKMKYINDPKSENWIIRHFILPVDKGVGEIRQKLVDLGIADNTIVWFVSDNGGTGGNKTISPKTRGAKMNYYEGGHRVPGIVWAPNRIAPKSISNELILSFDIMPTALAMAKIEVPADKKLDGVDLSGVLFNNEKLAHRKIIWNAGNQGALRDGNWKIVVKGSQVELFDLAKDPSETKNLAPNFPERVNEMKKSFDETVKKTRADSPYVELIEELKSKYKPTPKKKSGKKA